MTKLTELPARQRLRVKIVLIILLAAVAIATAAVFTVIAVKSHRRAEKFKTALAAFERGDDTAEGLLIGVIREDRNNEIAWAKLARIFEQKKHWRDAARCWKLASALNRLEPEYSRALVINMLRAHSYNELLTFIETLPASERERHVDERCLAMFLTGRVKETRVLLPEVAAKPSSDLRTMIGLLDREHTQAGDAELTAGWLELCNSSDPVVLGEALSRQYFNLFESGQNEPAEAVLRQMVELDPDMAIAMLGDFYYRQGRYEDAAEQYRIAMPRGVPFESLLRYAETLFMLKRGDELKKLGASLKQDNRDLLLCGYYIEALCAYLDKDAEKFSYKLRPVGVKTFVSPLAMLLHLEDALAHNDATKLLLVFKTVDAVGELRTLHSVAYEKAFPLLQGAYDNSQIEPVAPLAEWLLPKHRDELLLNRIVLLHKSRNNTASLRDFEQSLQRFPEDPVILALASEKLKKSGDLSRSLQILRQNIANGNETVFLLAQEVTLLESLGQIDEARSKLAALAQKFPDDPLTFKTQVAFAVRQGDPMPAVPANATAELAVLGKLAEGEKAYRENRRDDMVKQLADPALLAELSIEKEEDIVLLYYMALRLAGADAVDPAVAIYEKLQPALADPTVVCLNLSELYAASKRPEAALQCAGEALRYNSSSPAVQGCYGLRQWDLGNLQETVRYLSPLVEQKYADQRVLPAWRAATEKLIEQNFSTGQYQVCLDHCLSLQRQFPQNPVAARYLRQATQKLKAK